MGRRREKDPTRSQTLPPSPSHSFSSSSSSDFEFTISISPRKSSSALCPADELFYKGQLLPLHLSPRISMVRTLLLASSSTSSSSDTTTTASRDSTGSSSNESNSSFTSDLVLLAECDSSRPSSVTEDEEFRRLNGHFSNQIKKNKYFSLSRISSVFKKETKNNVVSGNSSMKKMSSTAKDVIRKYMKKVKPLYEKLSQKQQQKMATTTTMKTERSVRDVTEVTSSSSTGNKTSISCSRNNNNKDHSSSNGSFSHSFSGNLRYPRRKSCVSSCPSSMRSSPSHSGVLSRSSGRSNNVRSYSSDTSSMEELQSAIQGAIAHCKNSMNKSLVVSNEI
ncbi:hypothetical protein Ddye_022157 [Dipteronia dyeriana]|uniref:Membrane-associated kinase regulator 1 n=1 Tax=Dipteronia dyeriana TaxID=168575 RepID=A0AAD9U3I5_9ROSI|nr:hypothetical protein Ddye_022157 [Dipteronia dyeriana]